MDAKELKKILAGIGVVGLLAGGGVSVPGSAGASGWGAEKPGAVGTEKKAGSGWGGTKTDAVGVEKHVDEAKAKAGEVVEDAKAKAGEAVDKAKSEMKKEPAGSGWGATKPDAGSVDGKKEAPWMQLMCVCGHVFYSFQTNLSFLH